ncbi:MAG: hypothetical protein KJ773_05760 [Candidatus Thermoplasmatota archaeon]|nr:hypothetical protein [Candidatus Thermoplasmatota archaeon]
MLNLLTVLILACAITTLGLFIFVIRFAVKTEVVITTSILALVTSVGLFSWAMLSTMGDVGNQKPWLDLAYLCAILMFPLLIILFLQRSSSDYFVLMTVKGRVMVFGPLMAELIAHFLLPEDLRRFSDFLFLEVWLVISFMVWSRLYAHMHKSSSYIRKNQIEFMLASFFAVLLFNLVMLFGLFLPNVGDFSAIFSMAIAGALMVTVRGLVRYQMVIGKELLVRNSLIVLLTAVICVACFVVAQILVLSSADSLSAGIQIAASTVMLIVIVLSINLIGDMSAKVVEWMSPQLKWQESRVKEIFVLHSNGLVIAHAGAHDEFADIDRDLVGGMLTAIQNFVQEAFHASEMESLKSLSMGKMRVLIEAKGNVVIAVLFTGHEARELRKGVVRLIDELGEKFGSVLAVWKGEKRNVAGIQEWLETIFTDMASTKK